MLKLCVLALLPAAILGLALPVGVQQNSRENIQRLNSLQPDELAEELSGQFEGDIILSDSQAEALESPLRNGLVNLRTRWRNGIVPYAFSGEVEADEREYIVNALRTIEEVSCIRFVPRSNEKDYVRVQTKESGCRSYIGRQGGVQMLNLQKYPLGKGCFRYGTVVHEFLHALGFYHMQSSTDRDEYVKILWKNIMKSHKHNFKKYDKTRITNFDEDYDYGSVMHYSAKTFSKNGEYTIVPIRPDITPSMIGQRTTISDSDARRLRFMYNCE